MSLRYDTVTFLSDYGRVDEFVGVVHSVIRSLAPKVTVIDLTHDVPPYDVRAAGLTLARSAQYLCPGVVLAIVDPGVGTDRRGVAVEVGEGTSVLIGPDNGVLAPAVALCGGASRAVALTNPDFQLPAPGPTFAGRDVFAPAAAHLCNGVPLEELGEVVDPASLLPGVLPVTHEDGGALVGEVLWIDRYGNAQLNVDPAEIEPYGERVRLRFEGEQRTARRVRTFAELGAGEIGLVVDSYGLVAVVVDRRSAALELGLRPSTEVRLEPIPDGDEGEGSGITTAVHLARKEARP
ncbi:SAM hydrolase/SAM-dependent halogenase family protein [Rhabdothermincola sp.]|mgnify:CR=1 FL=1|uniref:SAM hydrolase/SAM-dependent halogenase family protein n=1 Tax=Rhabdothermincola sp. TaxID=2820405 RepID=UPI002FE26211